MKRILPLAVVTFVAVILVYISRFWFLQLWSGPGLFGWRELPPQGGLLGRWLRGTDFAPFELLIWAGLCFLALTFLQKLFGRFKQDTH
jgi:hypothetical protein